MRERSLTQAEMATMVNRAFGVRATADFGGYTDLAEGDWYYSELRKTVQMGHYIGPIEQTTGPVVTDNRPILEYRNPMSAVSYAQRGRENLAWLMGQKVASSDIVANPTTAEQQILDEYDAMIADCVSKLYARGRLTAFFGSVILPLLIL